MKDLKSDPFFAKINWNNVAAKKVRPFKIPAKDDNSNIPLV